MPDAVGPRPPAVTAAAKLPDRPPAAYPEPPSSAPVTLMAGALEHSRTHTGDEAAAGNAAFPSMAFSSAVARTLSIAAMEPLPDTGGR